MFNNKLFLKSLDHMDFTKILPSSFSAVVVQTKRKLFKLQPTRLYIATLNSHLHGNHDTQATGKQLRSNKDRGSVGNLYMTSYCNVAVQEIDELKLVHSIKKV